MLTPSVNVVNPEELQREISGLSRSIYGSTFGTAIAGTILVSVDWP